jgi:hypothetical protein
LTRLAQEAFPMARSIAAETVPLRYIAQAAQAAQCAKQP